MKKNLLLSICALLCASSAFADDTTTPLTVSSGFNIDAIAASTTDVPSALGPIDGHGSQFVAESYDGVTASNNEGVPVNGKLTTTGGHVYQLGNFFVNNCFYIGITAKDSHTLGTATSGTVTFSNPKAGNKLGILMAGTNRDAKDLQFNLKVTHQNGTTEDLGSFKVSDWGQNDKNDAVFTFTKRFRFDAGSNPESGSFRLSEVIATIGDDNVASPITSVTITTECQDDNWGYGSLAFYAFSAISTTTGIENATVQNAKVQGIYTVDGKQVAEPTKGVNVVKYTDGTARKVVVK
jgi:hypothetical protein